MLGDEEATVLDFYDIYWVLEVDGTKTGFFLTEHDAVRYLQNQMSVAEDGADQKGSGSTSIMKSVLNSRSPTGRSRTCGQ
jgi:hypothetical protein